MPIHTELPPASITLDDDLFAWIRSIGDTDPHDYPARKRELVRKLGFGPDWLSGNVKLPYDNIQKLIDAAVGLPAGRVGVKVSLGNRRFDAGAWMLFPTVAMGR